MGRVFDEIVWRTLAAMVSCLVILREQLPAELKVDAAICRAIHTFGRQIPTRPGQRRTQAVNRRDPV
jgi:hypothetical protein